MVNSGNTGAFYRYANSKLKSKYLVWHLSLLHLVMLLWILLLKLSYITNIFPLFLKMIITSCNLAPTTSYIINRPSFTIVKLNIPVCKLDPKSAGGLNDVPLIFLKSCKHSLSPPLAHLFSLCYTHSYLPPSYRLASLHLFLRRAIPCVSQIIGQYP